MTDQTQETGGERVVGSDLTAIAEYSETAAALADLRQRHAGVIYDVVKPKEMKAAKEARVELRTLRTSLEKKRVEIKAPALERCRLIDSEAKRITGELVALEEPIDVQIKQEEARVEKARLEKLEAERLRMEAINRRIDEIRNTPATMVGKPAVIIQGALARLKADELSEDQFQEQFVTARDAHTAAIVRVEQLLQAQLEVDEEKKRQAARDAKMEAMRRQMAEQQRLIDEAREREEAAEQARREAELRAQRVADEEKAAARQKLMNKIAAIGQPFHRRADVDKAQCIDLLAQARALELTEAEFGELLASAEAARESAIEQIHDAMQVLEQIAEQRAEREAEEARLHAERERQAAAQRLLDAQEAKFKREKAEAARKAEELRLASPGLREAAQSVVDHFAPLARADVPAVVRDLAAALHNDAAQSKSARAKKAAA